jgi:hypothetical protein
MSDRTRAGLVLGLVVASFASYALGIANPCWLGLLLPGIILGVCARIVARNIDPDYSTHTRLSGLARTMAQLALGVALLSPLWMFAVGELLWARRQQALSQALRDVRALADAQASARKISGTYLTIECLALGSRCPSGLKPSGMPFLSEPLRGRYRYTFRGVPQPGGRIDSFAYLAEPTTTANDCDATVESLVCADSAGRLCRMPASSTSAKALDSERCPAGCVDIDGPRPTPGPS